MIKENKYFKFNNHNLIIISGEDRFKFIQGLISNDIYKCNNGIIYASLLTPQGKFLFDFYIFEHNNSLLLESVSENLELIINKLNIYKLRSNVSINKFDKFKSIIINENHFGVLPKISEKLDFIYFKDPRKKFSLIKIYADINNLEQLYEMLDVSHLTNEEYHRIRLKNTIPDFFKDAESSKSLLLEIGFDNLNGIDWKKGCYMGQELTARTKYRGNLKKRIFGFLVDGEINNNVICFENKEIGFLTSFNSEYAIGIAKINEANLSIETKKALSCNNAKLTPFIPAWMKD